MVVSFLNIYIKLHALKSIYMYLAFMYSHQCTWARAIKITCTSIGISLQYIIVNLYLITLLNILNHFKVIFALLPQLIILKQK